MPLHMRESFVIDALLKHYEELKEKYTKSNSIRRNKNLLLPTIKKSISYKNSKYVAIKNQVI